MNCMDFGDLDFGFGLILDFGFGSKLKMALAIIDLRQRSVLEPFGSPKWQSKALPERRKIFIWIRIYTCELALRRLGKDILRDKRFGLKKEAQNCSGLL